MEAHLRKAPRAQQYGLSTSVRIKTLITSTCLKHSDFLKIDNWIKMCLTAVHMKPFSMKERVRRLGSTDSCPTAIETCEINTPLQTQHRSSVRMSHPGTTHPDDSDTTRRDRHPCLLHCSIRSPEPADTARETDFQETLWRIHQRDSLQYPLSQAPVSCFPELPATRVLPDQRVPMQRCDHGVANVTLHDASLSQLDSATPFDSSTCEKSCPKPSQHPCGTRVLQARDHEKGNPAKQRVLSSSFVQLASPPVAGQKKRKRDKKKRKRDKIRKQPSGQKNANGTRKTDTREKKNDKRDKKKQTRGTKITNTRDKINDIGVCWCVCWCVCVGVVCVWCVVCGVCCVWCVVCCCAPPFGAPPFASRHPPFAAPRQCIFCPVCHFSSCPNVFFVPCVTFDFS